jgi:hypothetical protein
MVQALVSAIGTHGRSTTPMPSPNMRNLARPFRAEAK